MKSKIRSKSYFVIPNEVIEKYRTREISAVDVSVYAYLCSLRRKYDGVRVSQKRIALYTGLSEKTVSASAERLYKCGLIRNIITETVKHKIKYKTSIYHLKPLPKSGFFFVPRFIFYNYTLSPKSLTMYLFLCKSQSFEYDKSWNSYSDICMKLGYSRNQRSEVVKLIGELAELGLIKKTVRKIKGTFADNIYRVIGFTAAVVEGVTINSKKLKKRFTKPVLTAKSSYVNWWEFDFSGGRVRFYGY